MLEPYGDRVVVMDIEEGGDRGIDLVLVDWFTRSDAYSRGLGPFIAHPGVGRVAVFTWWATPALVDVARRQGASGYLSKRLDAPRLVDAIVAAVHGVEMVVASVADDRSGLWPVPHAGLTEREVDVLSMLVDGRSNRDIASGLFMSVDTVKSHLKTIYRKLGVSNRTQAVVRALEVDF